MRFIMILFLAILLVSCTSNPTVASKPQTGSTQPVGQAGYPSPINTNTPQQPYPYPATPEGNTIPLPTLTPDPNMGSIKGILLMKGKPVVNENLYLAIPVLDSAGKEVATSIDRSASPRSKTNANGEFAFVNIPAGKYGLVLDMVQDSYLLLDPKNGQQMRFDVVAGKQMDLGKLDYDELPTQP